MGVRKIAVVLVDRANYGRMKPVMQAIVQEPALQMVTICAGSMVIERFGRTVEVVRDDGFEPISEIYCEVEGSVPTAMAKSIGLAVSEFATEFERLRPEVVLIMGDRYQALAAAIAASFMNICVAHIQGGEVSGSIDETTRHCITKLAHYHFPSTKRSAEFLARMGEDPSTIMCTGCPSGDVARSVKGRANTDLLKRIGFDTSREFLLVSLHPVSTTNSVNQQLFNDLFDVLDQRRIQTIWFYPNIDAGSQSLRAALQQFKSKRECDWLFLVSNFAPEDYLSVLSKAACAIGNSSSFLRDASFLGTPVVLIGDRQNEREVAENVLRTDNRKQSIQLALEEQLAHGLYAPSTLYGDGMASQRIARALATIEPYAQKRLAYLNEVTLASKKGRG